MAWLCAPIQQRAQCLVTARPSSAPVRASTNAAVQIDGTSAPLPCDHARCLSGFGDSRNAFPHHAHRSPRSPGAFCVHSPQSTTVVRESTDPGRHGPNRDFISQRPTIPHPNPTRSADPRRRLWRLPVAFGACSSSTAKLAPGASKYRSTGSWNCSPADARRPRVPASEGDERKAQYLNEGGVLIA